MTGPSVFRAAALKRLGVPLALDAPLELNNPARLPLMLSLAVVVLAVVVWGVLGTLPEVIHLRAALIGTDANGVRELVVLSSARPDAGLRPGASVRCTDADGRVQRAVVVAVGGRPEAARSDCTVTIVVRRDHPLDRLLGSTPPSAGLP